MCSCKHNKYGYYIFMFWALLRLTNYFTGIPTDATYDHKALLVTFNWFMEKRKDLSTTVNQVFGWLIKVWMKLNFMVLVEVSRLVDVEWNKLLYIYSKVKHLQFYYDFSLSRQPTTK